MELTKQEKNLLIYLETRVVDYCGRVDDKHLNKPDHDILTKWNETGFVRSGRIRADDITANGARWCWLSDEAYDAVYAVRRERAKKALTNKGYETTAEKNERKNEEAAANQEELRAKAQRGKAPAAD